MFLFIDVSEKNKIALKLLSKKSIINVATEEGDRKLTEKLLFLIDKFIKKSHLTLNKLDGIITVRGPGSFTSLRIMTTTVNTISHLSNIPIYSDKKENLNSDKKLIKATSKVKIKHTVKPFYDREPNITKPNV